nr:MULTISPECIES: FtsK/SpoIIIE domain-containing protein [Bifidobacterium]
MAAPLLAQITMVAIMIVQGHWLYALMIVPGAVGCLASILVSLPAPPLDTPSDSTRNHSARAGKSSDAALFSTPAAARHTQYSYDFTVIQAAELEQLLEFDSLPWRTMVRYWLGSPQWDTPLGMAENGPCIVNLRRQGPHALVAGTTGSGKSVLLQSWCLALAARNGPDRLNFVFLDFKGGSAFRELEQLPHCIGSVCDLDLAHATRALRALERELTRRERLTAEYRTSYIDDLPDPPARLFVVIDEFHALKDQLPDYINRLVRIASLGRSLGMHLIACTQNPMGQISADMKANMAMNICLRVRDELQSAELLGDGRASRISPTMPGAAYCNDSEHVVALRCASAANMGSIIGNIALTARFMGKQTAPQLFSAPLPVAVRARPQALAAQQHANQRLIWFGLCDDGITVGDAMLNPFRGNIGIIGGHGRGKSTVLETIAEQVEHIEGLVARISRPVHGIWRTQTIHQSSRSFPCREAISAPPEPPRLLWLVDDADGLFDPFLTDEHALHFRQALANPSITVVFTASSLRHIRIPEHCITRIVFPSGEKTADVMAGIPSSLLTSLGHHDYETPGRAVLITGSSAQLVQCAS